MGTMFKNYTKQVRNTSRFQQCKKDYDSLKLIKIIQEFVFNSDDRQYKYKAEDQAKRSYYNTDDYHELLRIH